MILESKWGRGGPNIGPPCTIILIIGTPKKVPLILGNPKL